MKIALALTVSVLLSGCTCRSAVMPDPMIPHRVIEPTCVTVAVRKPGDPPHKFSPECIRLEAGWWVASPSLIGGAP
jgi:hypothetical protein